jgi:hypothetical protein
MSDDIPMISLVRKGSKRYPRYIVTKADPFKNPLFWNGTTWTTNEADAVLFENVTQALWVHHDALMESVGDRPCHRYVAPVYIEVYGEKPSLVDLRRWLNRAVRIVANTPQHGHGPNGTVGVIILDVDETKPV